MSGTNGWNRDSERLLKNWSQQISINENAYRKRGSSLRKWYYGFGIFLVVAQTGALTTLINVIVTNILESSEDCGPNSTNIGLLIFIAIIETLILIAAGIDKFFNFGSASEQFFDAAKDHNALSRLIDATLTLPRVDRDTAREVLLSIRQQFNQIQDGSPNLPANEVIHRLDMCIYDDPLQARGLRNSIVEIAVAQDSPIPENVHPIELPVSPPDEHDVHDADEEHVSHAQRCKFNAQLQAQKKVVNREDNRLKGPLRALEYQWRRMERHGEEEGETSGPEDADTDNTDPNANTEEMV